ncbi:B12-binding domain-containing radical SAM protein, partial [bacterium]|nr:B12-binding domain-containing radical SAM protein [bacterium]
NEATSTITLLADTLLNNEDLSKVPGIYYKKNGDIFKNPPNLELDNFESVPFINFPLIKHEKYTRSNGLTAFSYFPKKDYIVYPIQTSFGCPYKCTFCINSILKRRYRMRSAEEIVNRIEFLQKEWNANFIAFYDEDFFVSKKRLLRFIELIEEKKLKFLWRTSLRVNYFRDDYLNDNLLKRLENIGFLCAVMGGESGNQRILDYLNKGITVKQILNSVKALSKTAIVPKISFMVGIPGETEKEIMQTYRFVISLKKIAKKGDFVVLPFRLYPGSKIYKVAISDYQHKEVTNLAKLSLMDEKNLKDGWGFYLTRDKKWIKNPVKFDLMCFFFETFIWPYYERKGLVRHLFIKIVMGRFYMNFFSFPFVEKAIYRIYMYKNLLKRNDRKPKCLICK